MSNGVDRALYTHTRTHTLYRARLNVSDFISLSFMSFKSDIERSDLARRRGLLTAKTFRDPSYSTSVFGRLLKTFRFSEY